jgi:hypothetical protein
MMIKQRTKFLLNFIVIILFFTIHCQKNGTGFSTNGITIRASDHSITITNHNIYPIRFFAVESKTAMLIDWVPACDTNDQNQIPASESIEIMYEDISGYTENCQIIVYWWFCIRKAGEDNFVYDKIRFEVIQTK